MVDRELVEERLQRLREYLALLRDIEKKGMGAYMKDPLLRGASERYLQLSLEILLDIGSHIIADQGLRKPESYADIFQILTENDVLSSELNEQLEGMAGFRNLLVHDYLRLDPQRVFQLLTEKLPVLEELAERWPPRTRRDVL